MDEQQLFKLDLNKTWEQQDLEVLRAWNQYIFSDPMRIEEEEQLNDVDNWKTEMWSEHPNLLNQ